MHGDPGANSRPGARCDHCDRKWIGADYDAAITYIRVRRSNHRPCDECGAIRTPPDGIFRPHYNPDRRVGFTRAGGFFWLALCRQCVQDYDYSRDPVRLAELAFRWQGRCFDKKPVGPIILLNLSEVSMDDVRKAQAKKRGQAVTR